MRYGSVCSGIEAASVAWEWLGWKASFVSEIEPFPRAVLRHRFPHIPLHGDFTTIKSGDYEPIDLLVGGTPCQAFSVAGLRGGLEDERGNLALEFIRLVKRLGPRYVLWENVPGVLSSNGGRDFGSILGALVQIGYGVAYRILDAQFFGVPQRRRRVFVVGCLGDPKLAAKILFDGDGMCRHSHKSKATGQDVANCLTAHFGSGRNDPTAETYIPSIANTLKAYSVRQQIEETYIPTVAHTLRGEGFDASEDGTGRGTPLIPVAFDTTQITSAANRSNPQPGDPCHPLAAQAHPPAIAFTQDQGGDVLTGEVMHNIATNGNATGRNAPTIMTPQLAVRRLTPRECERLQGFPDDWTLVPFRGKDAADGPRYKAIGNSMAVPVMRWIGERVAHYSGECAE